MVSPGYVMSLVGRDDGRGRERGGGEGRGGERG